MNKFEQLIEFVINDDEKNAKALFHEIVVEKSKDIYEEIMSEESETEKDDHAVKGHKNESLEESPAGNALQMAYDKVYDFVGKYDDAALEYLDDKAPIFQQMFDKYDGELDVMASKLDADTLNQVMDELNDVAFDLKSGVLESDLGGSQVDDLIDEVEAEEEGVRMEDEDEEIEMIDVDDDDDDEDLEDRVVDIEDKLDELMGEFEELMAQVDDNTDDIEGEQDEISDIDSDTDMEQDEIDDMDEPIDVDVKVEGLEEGVELVAAPKPVTTSPASKSPVAANSGQKGMDAKPVNIDAGNKGAQGRATPKYGDMNATTKPDVKPATKPVLAQASGVNTKSVID